MYYRIEDLLANCFVVLEQYNVKKINTEAIKCYNDAIEEYLRKSGNTTIKYAPVEDEKTYLKENFDDYFALVEDGKAKFYICREGVSKFDLVWNFLCKNHTNFSIAASSKDAVHALMFLKHNVKEETVDNSLIKEIDDDERKELINKLANEYLAILEEDKQNSNDMLKVIFSIARNYGINRIELLDEASRIDKNLTFEKKFLKLII